MPTIVADLGGLPFYSWVFSAYMLTRAVSLPIFGKLCDLFGSKKLYIAAILIFIVSSTLAGLARSMEQLILWRSIQGIGAGGTFALCYIALSDLYPPETRGKMMGMISVVWGISSILGPPVGGFIVAWSSWHWIFFINLPLGCLALLGIVLYLSETRQTGKRVSIDYAGALTLSISVIALLCVFLLGGRTLPWISRKSGACSRFRSAPVWDSAWRKERQKNRSSRSISSGSADSAWQTDRHFSAALRYLPCRLSARSLSRECLESHRQSWG